MQECVNYNCENKPFGKKIRCAFCRKKGEFLCMDCGASHDEPRALRCRKCYKINFTKIQNLASIKWNKKNIHRKQCFRCKCDLPPRRSKYCSIVCYNLENSNPRRRCQFCDKGLKGNQRLLCGSDECVKQYHAHYDYANLKKRSQQRKIQIAEKKLNMNKVFKSLKK